MNIRLINLSSRLGVLAGCLVGLDALGDVPFQAAINFPAVTRPSGVAVADLNGDGKLDMAVTTDLPDKINLYFSTGEGMFNSVGAPVLLGNNVGSRDLAAVDVDGDGDKDLIVVLQNISTLRVFLNNGAGVFTQGASAALGANARGMAWGDLNADGTTDFALANRDSNSVSVVLNSGGTLSSSSFSTGAGPRAVAIGDIDGDGDRDLVVTNHDVSTISVYRNAGNGTFGAPQTYSTGAVRPEGVAVGDINGDGRLDIAVTGDEASLGLHLVEVFTNVGGGSFSGPVNLNTGGLTPDHLVLADLDLDGDIDIAVTNQDSGNVSVFQNAGGGVFGAPTLYAVGTRPGTIIAADANANRVPDLIVTNRDSDNVSVLLNLTPPPPACGSADFNHDGDTATDADIEAFFACIAGNCCPACDSADFNGDGDTATDADIEAFFRVLAGGPC
jgi:FG-GAP-like repeat